jgi:hypothetical protein
MAVNKPVGDNARKGAVARSDDQERDDKRSVRESGWVTAAHWIIAAALMGILIC